MSDNKEEERREAEEIKTLVKDVERDTSKYILDMLQAVINEQVRARVLDKSTGNYIIEATRDLAAKKGWLE